MASRFPFLSPFLLILLLFPPDLSSFILSPFTFLVLFLCNLRPLLLAHLALSHTLYKSALQTRVHSLWGLTQCSSDMRLHALLIIME